MKYSIKTEKQGSEEIKTYSINDDGWDAVFVTHQGVIISESGNTANKRAMRAFETLRNHVGSDIRHSAP